VSFAATSGIHYHVQLAGYVAGQGMFYLRVYQGSAHPQPAPEPDTVITKDSSYSQALLNGGPDTSGARHSASFAFTSDEGGASFQCSLDGAAFSACSSPVSFDGLTGTHDFAVRSVVSGTPDPTPAVQRFTVDNTAPDTAITDGPTDPDANPSVTFQAVPTQRSSFDQYQCGLDSQPVGVPGSGCGSTDGFDGLCNRIHTFHIAALDGANNLDLTPATTSFTETGGGLCDAPTLGSLSATALTPTEEGLAIPLNPQGEGGALAIDYGTTASYGFHVDQSIPPDGFNGDTFVPSLSPGTLYHYRVTLTTPDGVASSGDQTFTTDPLGVDPLPTVSVGTPVVVGNHAAAIPLVVDPGNQTAIYGVFIDGRGPTRVESPVIVNPDLIPAGSGSVSRVVDVVDLDPGTYHLRGVVDQESVGALQVMGPDVTFSVPASAPAAPAGVPPPPLPPVQQFKLRGGFIKVLTIRHGSKTITLVISHLAPSTSVGVTARATLAGRATASKVKLLGRGRAKANKAGVARVKIKLSRKARKVLRSKRTKSVSLNVRVKPSGQPASSITLRRKLKR
jgi:hypothetical protein